MALDLEKMLVPISEDNPAGENEEYSSLYMGLEELAVGTPASTMGDSVVEGTFPNWKELERSCLKLWETTRDLRVAMYFTVAEFTLRGLQGFSDGLTVIEYLVENLWDNFYPQLDPDDDNDPTERINVFAMISPFAGAFDDPLSFISKFRQAKLLPNKNYTLRDYLIISGEIESSEDKLDPVFFQAEMHAIPSADLQSAKELSDKISNQIQHITDMVDEKLEGTSLSFASLVSEMKTLKKFYSSYALSETDDVAAEEKTDAEASDNGDVLSTVRSAPVQSAFNLKSYVPANRSDALLMLKKGAEYFQKAEPTSPVPLLVDRAMRMANMSFLDLLGDVEPNALEKGREIFGVKEQPPEE